MFGPDHDYKVGDDAWIYLNGHQGEMSKGTVIAILDNLPGYSYKQYVVEIPTSIDSLLEIRSSFAMRPSDPRISEIVTVLREHFSERTVVSYEQIAREILDAVE